MSEAEVLKKVNGKVWVITEGCYSDYRVVGVASSLETAQAIMAERRGEDIDCEEYDVDVLAAYRSQRVWTCYLRLEDGDLVEDAADGAIDFDEGFRGRVEHFGFHWKWGSTKVVRAQSTVSMEHACKIAVEERQRWLRERAGNQ